MDLGKRQEQKTSEMSFRFQLKLQQKSRHGLRNFAFQEKDSEMSSDYCFLFEKRAREGGCQGAPGYGHRDSFENGGALFLKHFFEGLFSQKSRNLKENGTQNGSQFDSFFVVFCRKANM